MGWGGLGLLRHSCPALPGLSHPCPRRALPFLTGTGHCLTSTLLQVQEGVTKVVDGVLFGVRGIKLLFTDIGSMGRLFWRAVNGEQGCVFLV